MMVCDLDDLGANHVISDMCQSHDCRDKLDQLHYANPNFKATLFAIPGEMTAELCEWCKANRGWIELAAHGFFHTSNYECADMRYEEIENKMDFFEPMLDEYFVKGFRAPGWQISDDWYQWLFDNDYWVADQSYNNKRRPATIPAYINNNGKFEAYKPQTLPGGELASGTSHITDAWHGHTWDCMANGIYESYDELEALVRAASDFQFVSELLA